ncbi:MAG: nuclear transport factor 2 family protein [Rhodospirillales bacterium]
MTASASAIEDDVCAIEAIVARQFASLNWNAATTADWPAFAADFLPGATLYPAARPAAMQTVDGFVERMKGLAQTSLGTFGERVLGTRVRVFGNVAVALGACEITENGTKVVRGVEAMLLVKDGGRWRIVSQAWDVERDGTSVPDDLIAPTR